MSTTIAARYIAPRGAEHDRGLTPDLLIETNRTRDGNVYGKISPDEGKVYLPHRLPTLPAPGPGQVTTHQLAADKILVLRGEEGGFVSFETKTVNLSAKDAEKQYEGTALPRQEGGQKVVDVGRHTLPAPAKGTADAYLLSPTKLLSLLAHDDGTVSVLTRLLGLFPTQKGFQGVLLPLEGKINVAGHELDVSDLTYNRLGLPRTKTLTIEGQKFRVDLLMNQDGTVSIAAAPPKGSLFSRLLGGLGKALDFVGNFAPVLAAIPGLGVAAKVLSIANAVTGFFDSAKRGNVLGMLGNAAGAVAGFAQGALQSFASKVANLANVGGQVVESLKHGLGQGLLQVVSRGASLVSGIAGAVGSLGQGSTRESASNIAQTAGDVARYTSAADSALKGQPLPLIANVAGDVLPSLVQPKSEEPSGPQVTLQPSTQGGVQFKPFDSTALPSDPGLQNATFAGFTSGPNLGFDTFGISGHDSLFGGSGKDAISGKDFLLANNNYSPSQKKLIPAGIQGYSESNLRNSITALENLGGGGMLNTRHDRRVYESELHAGLQKINAGLSGGKAGILKLKAEDDSWKAVFNGEPTPEQLIKYYTSVKNTANFILNNFSDFASQGGAKDTADHGDVEILLKANLLATPAPAPTPSLVDQMRGAADRFKESFDGKNQAIQESGGSYAGIPLRYGGKDYILHDSKVDMRGAVETYRANDGSTIIKTTSDTGAESYFQNGKQIFP